ncbi:hypothetical protein Poli38472_002175 [Pythium oligandrum]|uniref:Uncharacterized protein n=1 Tax=Pythium oligandrum TaxID=41045 RepID=A0A8K1CGQ8_PYTOL|nr:hypothetical protein Poli38472_002175 [Pythium oligandrum]|eukprot:TMW63234.1 hypothetical protein Poli38472_002175 [Pythium oligandrum]
MALRAAALRVRPAQWTARRSFATSADGTPTKLYFTTRDRIHGREVLEEYGMVSASAVRSKSVVSDMYVALAGLFGGEASSYTSLMNETMAEAVHRMQYAAQSLGATAVVNVRFDTNTTMNRLVFGMHCSVIAYGTAVRCRPASMHHHQPSSKATAQLHAATMAHMDQTNKA